MLNRRLRRIASVLLLVWIAFDLAALDTCALDPDHQMEASGTSWQAPQPRGAAAHPRAVLHADHCFCHGLSTGAGSPVTLADPFDRGPFVSAPPRSILRQPEPPVYHPPQRTA